VKTGASGQFLLNRLRPGKYRLMVTGGPNAQKLTGATLVDLGNEDAQNVALAAGPGAVVTGKIAFEGNFEGLKGPVNPRVARLALRSEVDAGGPGLVRGVVADDSTFRMENVPEGPARLSISLVTDAFYVKSITLNGQDVTNQPLNVVKNGQLDGVQMVISLVDAQLSGRVAPDANPQPGAPSPAVVLFPDTQASIQGPARVAHVNGSGQFTIRGIAPGNYRIVAVRNLAEGSESDPGFLTAVQGQAGQIAVAARKANAGIMQAIDAPR